MTAPDATAPVATAPDATAPAGVPGTGGSDGTAGTLLVVAHIARPALGLIEPAAAAEGLTVEVVRPVLGEPLPADPAAYAGVIVLGGPQSAYDPDAPPALADEIAFLARAHDRQVPVLGICLGSQLLSQALGGEALPGGAGLECGLIDVEPVDEAGTALAGRYFSFHSDTFRVPEEATVLARSDRYPQAWRSGNSLALQFHPELDRDGAHFILDVEEEKLARFGIDVPAMRAQVDGDPALSARGEEILAGWLENCSARLGAGARTSPFPHLEAPVSAKFVERYGLYTAEQREAAQQTVEVVDREGIEMVRLVWPDQHGLLRGKALTADAYRAALESGIEITMAPFFFDSANAIVLNPFTPDGGFAIEGLGGSPNVKMVPDPGTFTVLPWVDNTAVVFCDLYMTDGRVFPLAPRTVLRQALASLAERGFRLVAGIEMEWYLTRLVDDGLGTGSLGAPGSPADPPRVAPVARGYNYLLVDHLDEIDDVLKPIRRALVQMGLPLRSIDDEWAPSQVETTFDVLEGMAVADSAALFRMATKQIAKRNGYIASFMCTPAVAGFYASGWHMHTSLVDVDSGQNLMVPTDDAPLSELGRHYVGGTLAHGVAASVFTTPTVNGYRRRRPYSLAPDRLTWGRDNRAAMMRVIGGQGDPATHVENRVGDSAANPYLYLAAQVASGLDGVVNKTDPGPVSEDPYSADVQQLPTTLAEAVDALEADRFFRTAFGDAFVDYTVTMKRSEVGRYEAWLAENPDPETYVNGVTDWEHREYFENF